MRRTLALTARALLAAIPAGLGAQEVTPVYRELGSMGEGGVSAPLESPAGRFIVYRGIARREGEGEGGSYELRIFDRSTTRWSAFGPAGVDNAWTPRGDRLAFARLEERERELYVWTVPFDARAGRPSGPPRRVSVRPGRAPAFSPDGRSIAFSAIPPSDTAAPRIVVIPAGGGPERVLLTRPGWVQMVRWSPDGRWLYYRYHARIPSSAAPTLERVPAAGGAPETLRAVRDFIGISHDGRFLAYLPADGPLPAAGPVVGISTSDGAEVARFVLRPGLELGGWSADGPRLLAARRRVATSVHSIAPAGGPARAVATDTVPAIAPMWDPSGRRVAYIALHDAGARLVVADANGEGRHEIATREPPDATVPPLWSPDGRRVAFLAAPPNDGNGSPSVTVVDVATGEERSIASEPGIGALAWRRDGQALRYVHRAGSGITELREVTLDGRLQTLRSLDGDLSGGIVTLVGDSVAVVTSPRGAFALSLGARAVRRIYAPDTTELEPRWFRAGVAVSRDGRWAALPVLDRSGGAGHSAVRLVSLAGESSRVVPVGWISYRSGFVWHPDGRHLVVLGHRRNARRAEMWLIPLDRAPSRPLTTGDDAIELLSGPAISPDGASVAYSVVTGVTSTLWEVDLTGALPGAASRDRR